MNDCQVSAIMPSLNEELNICSAVQNVIDSYARLGIKGEIVIVNDGSSDTTGVIAEELRSRYSFVRVIHHDFPLGIGAAFWDGVRASCGDIVVMLPGDGENDAAEILQYLPLMSQVDIVIPFIFNKEIRSIKRRLLSTTYTKIINLSFATSLHHTNGTVMYRRCVLEGLNLKASGFFFQTELLVKLIRQGYLYAEVPYALFKRAAGQSKALSFRTLRKVVASYICLFAEIALSHSHLSRIHADSVTATRRT